MKSLLFSLIALCLSAAAHASGPWQEYRDAMPPAGTPAAQAAAYVQEANRADYSACRRRMTADYAAWLDRVGGLEQSLQVFTTADLDRRFAWREAVTGDTAIVWVRVYVVPRGREVNVALNLILTSSGWKLTI